MRRRQYLAVASSLLVAGCSDLRAMGGSNDSPSGTEPLSGSFTTPSDDSWWTAEVNPDSSLYTPDDVYVYSKNGMDRFSPDGTRRWHVEIDEPSKVVSGGSTLYHGIGPSRDQSLMARDVGTGDELWTYETAVHTIAASESAVFVGATGDGGGGEVSAIDAESGEKRWGNWVGRHFTPALTHDLCLVPHWKGMLSAFDATTGDRRWQHGNEEDKNEALQVVGDAAYQLTESNVAGYALPDGEERWNRSLDPQQQAMAVTGPDAARTDTIVTGSSEGTLHGFDAETGETAWELMLPGDVQIGRILRWEETVAVVGDGILYGFDLANGDEQWRQDLGSISSADPRAVNGGTLFLVTVAEDDEVHVKTYDMESGRRRWSHAVGEVSTDYGVATDWFIVGTEAGTVYGFSGD